MYSRQEGGESVTEKTRPAVSAMKRACQARPVTTSGRRGSSHDNDQAGSG